MPIPAKRDSLMDELFGIDVRGLATFRIALGLLLCAQAVLKLRQLPLLENALSAWLDLDWVVLLACGGAIAVGRGVRWSCLLCWPVMFRHIMADYYSTTLEIHRYLLLIGLFWILLIPSDLVGCLGGASGNSQRPRRVLSYATAALLMQVFFLYFSAGAAKAHVEWIVRADALENLMHTHFATPLGNSLLAFPWLLRVLSIATIALEVLGPVACFFPGRQLPAVRNVVIALMTSFHLGLALTMNLETIPLVCQAWWLLMVPSKTWDRIWPRCDLLPETAGEPSPFLTAMARLMLGGMCASFAMSLLVPCDPTGTLIWLHQATPKIGIYQDWRMFRSPATLRRSEEGRAAPTET